VPVLLTLVRGIVEMHLPTIGGRTKLLSPVGEMCCLGACALHACKPSCGDARCRNLSYSGFGGSEGQFALARVQGRTVPSLGGSCRQESAIQKVAFGRANLKYFFFHPSHRIFRHMHGALNIAKKDN
jgi:hypothetical protein